MGVPEGKAQGQSHGLAARILDMRILYITHYGILEPLGQSQILPYLTSLARRGNSIRIISFEKPEDFGDLERVSCQRSFLESLGIGWSPRPYRRGDSIRHLCFDVWGTSREIRRRCIEDSVDVLHCRAHVPAWMALSSAVRLGIPMLFDFRGFLAEEYVDAGMWTPGGLRYRAAKMLERILVRRCSAMVVLTEPIGLYFRTRHHLQPEKIFTIPCCVDLSRFNPAEGGSRRGERSAIRTVYVGSTAGRYRLEAMLGFFRLILIERPGSTMTILSSGDLRDASRAVVASGVPPDSLTMRSAAPQQVPEILRQHDLGLAFIRGDLALQAASPTKIGEYLASGLAVVAEERIGGLREILVEEGAGCLIDSGDQATWPRALESAISICSRPGCRDNSLRTARKFYDLEKGVTTYDNAYRYCVQSAATRRADRQGRH